MGFLIQDPRQWLQTPSFVDSSNLAQQPSPVDSPMPQQEDPNSPEAFSKRLMQEIANRQQQAPQQDVQAILMDLISKRRPPGEEARLRQLRAERPEDIQARMRQSLLGAPATSKLGKFGQTALEVAAGAFGVMPNTNKAALEQYKAQQAAANSEEAIDQKVTAAQAQAISAMNRTRQQADAAEQKNKVTMFGKMMDDLAKERQAKISALDTNSKIDLRTRQAEKMKIDMDLAEKFGTIKALGGLKGGFQLQQVEEILGKDAAQRVAQAEEAIQNVRNSSKNKDAQSVPTTSPLITQDANGNTQILGTKTSVRTTPAVNAGDKNALTKLFGLPSPIDPNTPTQAPRQPGASQPQVTLPPQPRIAPQPSIAPQAGVTGPTPQIQAAQGGQFEQVGTGGAPTPFSQSLDTQYRGKKYRVGNGSIDAFAVPNNWQQIANPPVNGPKLTTAQADAKAALDIGNNEIANLNSFLEEASKKGQAQMLFNNPRGFINNLKPEWAGKTGALAKWGANPDISQLQSSFELMQSGALSRKIFALSGKASSEKEAQRFELTLPNKMDPWDVNLSKSFYGAVMGPAMTNLAEAGLLHGSTVGPLADAAQEIFKQRNDAYLSYVRNIAKRGGVETPADTAALKRLKDPNIFQVEVLQRAFPQYEGKDLVIDEGDKNRKIHVYIPRRVNDKEARGTKAASIEERIKSDPAYRKKLKDAGLIPEED